MSRGFHAFFRQYYNLRALLRRVDPALTGLTRCPTIPSSWRTGRPTLSRRCRERRR